MAPLAQHRLGTSLPALGFYGQALNALPKAASAHRRYAAEQHRRSDC